MHFNPWGMLRAVCHLATLVAPRACVAEPSKPNAFFATFSISETKRGSIPVLPPVGVFYIPLFNKSMPEQPTAEQTQRCLSHLSVERMLRPSYCCCVGCGCAL